MKFLLVPLLIIGMFLSFAAALVAMLFFTQTVKTPQELVDILLGNKDSTDVFEEFRLREDRLAELAVLTEEYRERYEAMTAQAAAEAADQEPKTGEQTGNPGFHKNFQGHGVGAQRIELGLLVERIDPVEGVVAGADTKPRPVLNHVDRCQPNVDSEVVGAVAPASQETYDAGADRFEFGGGDDKNSCTQHQHQQWGKASQHRRPLACGLGEQQHNQH